MHWDVDQPSVTVEDVGDEGVVVAAVHGDLDVDTFRQVRQALFSCLNGRTSALVVDLGDVGFFGSMGIAVLVEARQRADVVGAGFAVVAGRRTVARPIRLTDTEDLLRLHRTMDEALAGVRGGSGHHDHGYEHQGDQPERYGYHGAHFEHPGNGFARHADEPARHNGQVSRFEHPGNRFEHDGDRFEHHDAPADSEFSWWSS
ncbi:STAS domain-containing protein [Actinosynnema sp. NPDC023658]|uniref:STAS domain-containing protein n=1 Tax=Actinosynnema sp. NPDC023658 TaxID=3155465 RepID=UPI0034115558